MHTLLTKNKRGKLITFAEVILVLLEFPALAGIVTIEYFTISVVTKKFALKQLNEKK